MKHWISVFILTTFFAASIPLLSLPISAHPVFSLQEESVRLKENTTLYAGPGNVDYESLAQLPSGTEVTAVGSYADFVQVETLLNGVNTHGFLRKTVFGALPPGLPQLAVTQVPWQPIFTPGCFVSPDPSSRRQFNFLNERNDYLDLSSYPFQISGALRITAQFNQESGSFYLIRPSMVAGWYDNLSLKIVVSNGNYRVKIRDAASDLSESFDGPPSSDQSISLLINDPQGKSFSILDGSQQVLQTVDVTHLKSFNLPNGLFPKHQIGLGLTFSPNKALDFKDLVVEEQPTGKWQAVVVTPDAGLRQLAQQHGIKTGTEFNFSRNIDPRYCQIMHRDFDVAVISDFTFKDNWFGNGDYDFNRLDQLVNYASSQGWRVRASHLVWGASGASILPDWLLEGSFSRDEYIHILEEHVKTVVGRYKGKVQEWSIANEAITLSHNPGDDFWRSKIGPDYIEMSFRWAHEADPNAILIFNDNSNESLSSPSNRKTIEDMLQVVKELKARGTPIDVVGMQMHLLLPWNNSQAPKKEEMVTIMRRFGDLGVKIAITEMDINLQRLPGNSAVEKLQAQAKLYQDVLAACLESGVCTSFTTWGISDIDSWVTCTEGWCANIPDGDPLLFDRTLSPKPAYFAVQEILQSITP